MNARIIQKDVGGGPKATLIRPALGEVTTTAVNRKDNKNSNDKEKEEVGLKRGRSNSSANVVQRVPLGPGRSQAAPPVANVVPVRAPLSRASRPLALNNTRQLSRAATSAFVVHEDAAAANDQEDVDMDVEEDLPITSQIEQVQPSSERVAETAPIQIHEDMEDEMNVVDDVDSAMNY
ncbi:hypothetical protein MPER_04647 [Moniliophthora perniciosa FA553]|nr:hypothetical protein MPER_04647 [Moniliophthora perniciosa FA553]